MDIQQETNKTQNIQMTMMIDPDGGWQFGFPKPKPTGDDVDMRQWLIDNGYPEQLIEYWEQSSLGYVPCRMYVNDEHVDNQ
jgi:hypothetical protein